MTTAEEAMAPCSSACRLSDIPAIIEPRIGRAVPPGWVKHAARTS